MYQKKSRFLFLPWPAAIFGLLCIGVLLIGWTLKTAAADLTVRAEIHAPPPTGAATITSPVTGKHFRWVPISVSGTCPSDGSAGYIKLYRNNVFSGSALCQADNSFQLNTDLFAGANNLVARVFNITDDEGPISNTVRVYYDVPVQPVPKPTVTPPGHVRPPFLIKTDTLYNGYFVGQEVNWRLEVAGGVPPYAVHVSWGDGKSSNTSLKKEGYFTISHTYLSAGKYKNSYKITINGSDYEQRQAYLEFFALINPSLVGPVAGNIQPQNPIRTHWLWFAWPAYIVVLLMALSYWLGEREELIILSRKGLILKRRP
jgi:hypothetical protein